MTADAGGPATGATGAPAAVAKALFEALSPLAEALDSPAAFEQLLRDLGYECTVTATALAGLDAAAAFAELVPRGEELVDRLDGLAGDDADWAGTVADLVGLGSDLLAAVDGLRHVDGAGLGPDLADPALWTDLAEALPGYLVVQYLENEIPLVYALLRFCGVIVEVDAGSGTREVLDGDQLARLAADPVGAVRDRYGWGQDSGFRHQELLDEIALALTTLGLEVRTGAVGAPFAARFFGTDPAPDGATELVVPLASGVVEGAYRAAGLALIPVPPATGGEIAELVLSNTDLAGAVTAWPLAAGWSLRLTGDLDATGLVGLRLTATRTRLDAEPPGGSVSWTLTADPAEPWQLLGGLVEVGGLDLEVAVSGPADAADLVLSAQFRDMALVLSLGDGDAFLQYLVGSGPLRVELSPIVAWSARDGLTVSGNAGLDVLLPLTLDLGVVVIEGVHLLLTGDGAAARLQADVGATGAIGPFVATMQGIGAALGLSAAAGTGSLGALDVGVSFVPPTGVGFAIASDIATGGGYVEADPDAGRYAGVLDVELLGVGLTAIGILTTRMPDGGEGWSLFLSLTATFASLPLGFGFTLDGVGGLIGVDRGLDDDALGDGIRAGNLDTLLFPEDPVADAATILSEIDSVFPVREGQFVFGPVATIGWGTPTVLEMELGVVVELPDPVAITILGSLSTVLPDDTAAVLVLNVDVAGTIDLSAGTVAVDASLHDSQVAGVALSGDMAIRADFLSQPSFLLSFGGFNPHFAAPGSFPDLDRLSAYLDGGDDLHLDLWGYFAVSSNTVQFGAGADIWARADGLTVEGHLSFDVLIQFDPFRFIVQMAIEVSVRAGSVELFGVHLDMSVAGPNPFHVTGTASVKILGVRTSFSVDESIGQTELDGPPEPVNATALLLAALRDAGAWREVPPDDPAPPVLLTEDPVAPDAPALRVHPAGALEVVQRVVPLKRTLDHYGTAPLGDLDHFELVEPTVGGQPAQAVTDVVDWFAPAEYYDLDEDEKLSAPSFEQMPAGLRLGTSAVTGGRAAAFVLDYEQIVRDPELDELDRPSDLVYQPRPAALATALRYSTSARPRPPGPLSPSRAAGSPYGLRPVSWVVTDGATGVPVGEDGRLTWSQARTAARGADTDDPVLAPGYEAQAVPAGVRGAGVAP